MLLFNLRFNHLSPFDWTQHSGSVLVLLCCSCGSCPVLLILWQNCFSYISGSNVEHVSAALFSMEACLSKEQKGCHSVEAVWLCLCSRDWNSRSESWSALLRTNKESSALICLTRGQVTQSTSLGSVLFCFSDLSPAHLQTVLIHTVQCHTVCWCVLHEGRNKVCSPKGSSTEHFTVTLSRTRRTTTDSPLMKELKGFWWKYRSSCVRCLKFILIFTRWSGRSFCAWVGRS